MRSLNRQELTVYISPSFYKSKALQAKPRQFDRNGTCCLLKSAASYTYKPYFMGKFETYPNILLKGMRSLRTDGVFLTAKYMLRFIKRETLGRYFEWRFDRKWGVKTAGVVYPSLKSANPLHLTAEKYEGTSPRVFQKIMRSVGCLTMPFVFFDMGCGKGRVLLMASKYAFKRVVGVEFSPELAKIAEANVTGFQSRRSCETEIEVVCADAAKYQFPNEHALVFFFNPFKEEVMAKVLENIKCSAQPDKAYYIIYYNPALAALMSDPRQFSLIVKNKKYHIYRVIP